MPKIHHVKKAIKPRPKHGIAKGDSYYWWRTRTSHGVSQAHYSRTLPNDLQTSGSEFLRAMGDIEVLAQKVTGVRDFHLIREQISSMIRKQRTSIQENLDRMPEMLRRSAPSAYMLEDRLERLDRIENYINDQCARLASAEPGSDRYLELLDQVHAFRYDGP